MEAADEPGSAAIKADLRFHRAILAGAHNDLLLQMGNLIGAGLTVSYRLSTDSFSVFLPLHKKVLDAILAHDATAAHDAMERLLSDTRDFLEKRLSRARGKSRPAAGKARGGRTRTPV